jgi:CHAT domain-containing protein
MNSSKAVLLSTFLLLFTVTAVRASDSSDLDRAVRDLYARYSDADLVRFKDAWAGGQVPEETLVADTFDTKCITISSLTVDSVTAREADADVAATVTIEKRARATGAVRVEHRHPLIHFVRRDGRWLADRWDSAESRLAKLIGESSDDAEAREEVACAAADDLVDDALVRALADLAISLVNRNRMENAKRTGRTLAYIADAFGDPLSQSRARGAESVLLRFGKPRDLDGAVKRAEEALVLAEQSRDADLIALSLLTLGRAHDFRDPSSGLGERMFRKILPFAGKVEERAVVSRAAFNTAISRIEAGDYRAALRLTELGNSMLSSPQDYNGHLMAESILGDVYMRQGDYEVSALHYRRSMELAVLNQFNSGVVAALSTLVDCYRLLGDEVRFHAAAAEALQLAKTGAFTDEDIGDTLTDIGLDAIERHRFDEADKALTEAVARTRNGVRKPVTASALSAQALLRLRQHRYREAIDVAKQVDVLLPYESSQQRFDVAVVTAKALRALGDRPAAEAKLRHAISGSEEAREQISGDERQARLFFDSRISAYVELIDLLIAQGRIREALEIAEKAKGRTLLDVMSTGSRRVSSLTKEEAKREEELVAAVAAANRAVEDARASQLPTDPTSRLQATFDERRLALESLRAELASRHPLLALQREGAANRTSAELVAVVPRDVLAIEYVTTDTRLHIFTIARGVDGKPRVRVHSVAIDNADLARTIKQFVGRIANRDHDYRAGARRLYDLLLAPVEGEMKTASALRIVPAGPLWTLPFEALRDRNGKFLVERKIVSYIPSLTVWSELEKNDAKQKAQEAFFGIGNPKVDELTRATVRSELGPLPEAELEVKTISKLFDGERSEVLIGANAVEERVKEDSPGYRVLHFATHARIDDHNPMYSHIVLARGRGGDEEDGLLEAWEMMQLDLHADLAVLSACDTARGGADAGEGVIGMTWALFAAGCRSTLASEWKVPSAPTADLMIAFYEAWLHEHGAKFGKASALRTARLKMLRDPARSHPYYWAAFVLVGGAE